MKGKSKLNKRLPLIVTVMVAFLAMTMIASEVAAYLPYMLFNQGPNYSDPQWGGMGSYSSGANANGNVYASCSGNSNAIAHIASSQYTWTRPTSTQTEIVFSVSNELVSGVGKKVYFVMLWDRTTGTYPVFEEITPITMIGTTYYQKVFSVGLQSGHSYEAVIGVYVETSSGVASASFTITDIEVNGN